MKALISPPGPQHRIPRWKLPRRKEALPYFLYRLAQQYGDIVRFQIGKQEYYLLNHPRFIQTVLEDTKGDFQPLAAEIALLPPNHTSQPPVPDTNQDTLREVAAEQTPAWVQENTLNLEVAAQHLTEAAIPKPSTPLRRAVAVGLYLLAYFPEIQETIRQESQEKAYSNSARMFFAESLRLFPPIPISNYRITRATPLGGYLLPAGALAVLSAWVMHHDPRYYADAFTFKLDHWTPAHPALRPPLSYFPFGGSARSFAEEMLALDASAPILAAFAATWRISLPSGKKITWQSSRPSETLKVRIRKC